MAETDIFVMIKPDGVERGLIGTILQRFERRGFSVTHMKMLTPTESFVRKFYGEHSETSFFENLVKFTCSGPVVAMVIKGNVQVARKIVGSTAPWNAEKGTIRGDFSSSLLKNMIHCSDGNESAEREVALWLPLMGY